MVTINLHYTANVMGGELTMILNQGWWSRSGRHGDYQINVLTEMVSLTLCLQVRNTHIVCTDPCPQEFHGPNIKESHGYLRMSRLRAQ